jgi:hypothetical protein
MGCWEQLGLALDGMRPTLQGASALSARGSCDSGNDMMLLYHLPPSDVCEPSPSKGVERRGGVPPSAELAAAGRWSYGNERCVGGLATVLLHSCVRPATLRWANRSACNWEELL